MKVTPIMRRNMRVCPRHRYNDRPRTCAVCRAFQEWYAEFVAGKRKIVVGSST